MGPGDLGKQQHLPLARVWGLGGRKVGTTTGGRGLYNEDCKGAGLHSELCGLKGLSYPRLEAEGTGRDDK